MVNTQLWFHVWKLELKLYLPCLRQIRQREKKKTEHISNASYILLLAIRSTAALGIDLAHPGTITFPGLIALIKGRKPGPRTRMAIFHHKCLIIHNFLNNYAQFLFFFLFFLLEIFFSRSTHDFTWEISICFTLFQVNVEIIIDKFPRSKRSVLAQRLIKVTSRFRKPLVQAS